MGKNEEGYVAAPEFEQDTNDSLFDIVLNDDTELWLVQLPDDQFPDLDGQKLTLDFDQDGELGSVKGSDGVVYSVVNFPSDVSETTVFQPTPSGTKFAGKISRHVSLIHYPEPNQLGATTGATKKRMPMSSKTSYTKSHFSTPTRTTSHKGGSSLNRSESIPSSRKSGLSETSGISKIKRVPSGRSRQSGESEQGHSGLTNTTVSGSSEQSHHKRSKGNA